MDFKTRVVSSPEFEAFGNSRFSFFACDINGIESQPGEDGERLKQLIEKHKIVETPVLLFLKPESEELVYLHSGHTDSPVEVVIAHLMSRI